MANGLHLLQSYALTLADKTKQLNREKQRTDSLLYQMLPKSVAEQLKQKKDVNAEYFKEVLYNRFFILSTDCQFILSLYFCLGDNIF